METLDTDAVKTAAGILEWAFNVCHPVKGTYKTGPKFEPIAEYLAECVRLREFVSWAGEEVDGDDGDGLLSIRRMRDAMRAAP